MPESPEVDALAEFLDERLRGQVLQGVDILEFRAVKTRARQPSALVGQSVQQVRRIGKHLDLRFDLAHLIVSLGRHGWVRWADAGTDDESGSADAPALASLEFAAGTAHVTDAGSWVSIGLSVADHPNDVPALAKLGPDPAAPDFTRAGFDAALVGRRKQLKAVLQEQESVAGIGNAYSDEILHLARLSPVVPASALDDVERGRLYDATVSTIRGAIADRRGIPIDRLKSEKVAAMRVHGRAGAPCPVCAGVIAEVSFGSAAAQYCPTCQTGGAVL